MDASAPSSVLPVQERPLWVGTVGMETNRHEPGSLGQQGSSASQGSLSHTPTFQGLLCPSCRQLGDMGSYPHACRLEPDPLTIQPPIMSCGNAVGVDGLKAGSGGKGDRNFIKKYRRVHEKLSKEPADILLISWRESPWWSSALFEFLPNCVARGSCWNRNRAWSCGRHRNEMLEMISAALNLLLLSSWGPLPHRCWGVYPVTLFKALDASRQPEGNQETVGDRGPHL